MTDLFEENMVENEACFEEIETENDLEETATSTLDARRRLEKALEEKRLKEDLDDFGGY